MHIESWLNKNRYLLASLLISLGLCLSVGWSTAKAQTSEPPTVKISDDQVNTVARELYCPVCENIPLDVCPTKACAQWRDIIRAKLEQGWATKQIQDYFALQYGDRVLAEPPLRGLNWLIYILPVLFFLGGIFIVVRILRQASRKPAPETPAPAQSLPENTYMTQFEKELHKREKS